jgi:hypothetical protein
MSVLAGGCNVVGSAAYIIQGPDKVSAAFELPEDRSVLVFIDNSEGRIPERRLVSTASAAAESELLNLAKIVDVIDSRPAQLVVRRESAEAPMPIVEIGRAVDAELIVYVAPDEFILSSDGASYSPKLSAYVKVIDTVSGERLWPKDPEGFRLNLSPPPRPGLGPSSAADRRAGNVELANLFGQGIAQLFYDVDRFRTVR